MRRGHTDTDRADGETTTVEHLHCGGKALADVFLAADHRAGGRAHVLEDGAARVGGLLASRGI